MANCVSPITMEIFWSDGGTTWTDISGSMNSVTPAEQTRMTGQVYAFGDELPCVGYGSREPLDIDFEIIYTETATDAYQTLYPYFTAGSELFIRWIPAGSGSGSSFTAQGKLTRWVFPGGDADNADPAIVGFSMHVDEVDVV